MTTTASPTIEERMSSSLDELEERLPRLPAAMLRFERALAGRGVDLTTSALRGMRRSVDAVNQQADRSARTVAGTARRAVETTVTTARTGFRTTSGQGGAQMRRVAEAAGAELADTHDAVVDAVSSATETVDPADDATTGYDRWTKAELYEKATEMEIEGRSSMSKAELLSAIRAH